MKTIRINSASFRLHPRGVTVGGLCLLTLFLLGIHALSSGSYSIPVSQVYASLSGHGDPGDDFIIGQVRLPRFLAALIAGLALGIAGGIFQQLTRNPLGSPDILGLTQGASAGALSVIVFASFSGPAAVALGGIGGALLAGGLLYALAWKTGGDTYRLILVGIGIAAIAAGFTNFLLTRSDIYDASRAMLWLTGDLNGRDWEQVTALSVALLLLVPLALSTSRSLTMMGMGNDTAAALGVAINRTYWVALTSAALLTAGAVAVAGPLAFVALTAPHLARWLTGSTAANLWSAGLMGGGVVVAADAVALAGIGGRQLPTGVVTGVVGGGYLIWLLIAQRQKGTL